VNIANTGGGVSGANNSAQLQLCKKALNLVYNNQANMYNNMVMRQQHQHLEAMQHNHQQF